MFSPKLTPIAIALFLLAFVPRASAQKVSEVLSVTEDQIIGGRDKFLLRFNANRLEYDFWYDNKTKFIPLKDSILFLSKQSSIVIYVKPLNPLNYSFENALAFVPNPIDQEAAAAIELITKSLTDLTRLSATEKDQKKAEKKKVEQDEGTPNITCDEMDDLIARLTEIQTQLKKDNKDEVKTIFEELQQMKFEKEAQTKTELDKITPELEPLQNRLGDIKVKIEDLQSKLKDYDCVNPHPFVVNYIFSDLIAKANAALKAQKTRYENLKKCLDLVTKVYVEASSADEGLKWILEFKLENGGNTIEVQKGQVANFTVTVNETGFKLSDDNEIVAQEKKVTIQSLVRIMKFQRFLPEVIPGVGYTFLQFPKYSTTTDGAGKQVVAEAGNEEFKRVNFNAMVNFNYFVPNSVVNPFLQLGIGANTDYPSFFVGGGFRFDLGSGTVKALSVSGGIVSTWIQTLNKYKVGDVVPSTADLEKDLTHEFHWPPKPYIGIQMKF
jgi:hypothetical protein